jgi:hypothetical protein
MPNLVIGLKILNIGTHLKPSRINFRMFVIGRKIEIVRPNAFGSLAINLLN